MSNQRAEIFARCAVALAAELHDARDSDNSEVGKDPFATSAPMDEDPFVSSTGGPEGVFEQALSNGLAAIVAHEWPGQEAHSNGHIRSARELLRVIMEHARRERLPEQDAIVLIPDKHRPRTTPLSSPESLTQERPQGRHTPIDVSTLLDGINVSQPARHARGAGGLQRRHIEALLALDGHESLRKMGEQQHDRIREQAWKEDAVSQKRAAEYLERIGEEEAARRAEAVENPNACHPKHNPDGRPLDTCPVCEYETFCVDGLAPIWGRVAYGQCLVCTYTRTPDTAEDEGYAEHVAWIMGE
ncbi:hypothetical protein [Streptomyces sp. NPDC051636]|uniref:hypothetical protein n=1 Tax=Streptomyces sp. NPDC051636 TaxID=3365663 RepID=UPI0037A9D924